MKYIFNFSLCLLLCGFFTFLPDRVLKAQDIDVDTDINVGEDVDVDDGDVDVERDRDRGIDADGDVDFPTLELGLRFQPTVSSLAVRDAAGDAAEVSAVVSYGFAGLVGLNFTRHIGIQGEIIYLALAQKYAEHGQIKLRYLNIPLLLSLNTGKDKVVNFNVVAGPQIGLNVGTELDVDIEPGNGDEADAVLAVKKGDLGIAYGAGLDFGLNPDRTIRLGVGFRGVYGFIDISDDSGTHETNQYLILDKTHIKTYSGYLSLAYMF